MNMKFLFGSLLLLICSLTLTGCSDDENGNASAVTPFSLEKTYYEARLRLGSTKIPITNGSGDISLSVADKTIIEANKVLNEGGSVYVSLQGKQKGSTTLTLRDNVTGDESESHGLLYSIRHCRKQSPCVGSIHYGLSGR